MRKEYRKYQAYLDDEEITNTAEFYASPSKIQTISLRYRNHENSKTPYLNIVTK